MKETSFRYKEHNLKNVPFLHSSTNFTSNFMSSVLNSEQFKSSLTHLTNKNYDFPNINYL